MITEAFKSNSLALLHWQVKNAAVYGATGLAAWVLIEPMGQHFMEIPVTPISIMGAAIGIFASFRANQAYDRWWEGRKLWGRLINSSRHFCDQARHYVGPKDAELAERLTLRHVLYVHTLRCLLRNQAPFLDPDFVRSAKDLDPPQGSTNLTHALLDAQLAELTALSDQGRLDGHRLESLDRTLMDLLNIQGGCERIKGTPLPRGYGFILEALIRLFSVLLPFSLVHDLHWVAIPLNVLVCLSFALISEAGRVLEDPFSLFYNGLPLHNLSIKIERNLRERLGLPLPPPVLADGKGVLM